MKIKKFTFLLSIILSFCCAQNTIAGTDSYFCVVKTELHLDDDGTLEQYPKPLALGEKFAVDRATGRRIENTPWWGTDGEKITLLAAGNESNSFVAVYTAEAGGEGVFLMTLRIEEFAKNDTKPFLLTASGSVYAGYL